MKILLSILILILLPTISFSQQEKEVKKRPPRTDKFIRMKGIRVGYDLTRPFQYIWNVGDRYGSELSFDMEVSPNLFPVFETGWETRKLNSDYIDYKAFGTYSRVGFDYNFLVAENKQDKDILFMGLRYGFSFAKQQVNSYTTNTSYWDQQTGSFPSQNYNAHWTEIVLGTRVQVFHNLFLGWSIRGKILINYKDFDTPPVYFIPGYGKAENGFNFDFSYSIFYNLPVDVLKIFRKGE